MSEEHDRINELEARIDAALDIINAYGGTDGAHHKQWALDQVVRCLTKEHYPEWVRLHCNGEDGPDTYSWDEGIAP